MSAVWGDFHLDFDARHAPSRGRSTAPWVEVDRAGRGVLWAQGPSSSWVGHAVREAADGSARAWLVGATHGRAPSDATLLDIARGIASPAAVGGSWLLVGWAEDADHGARWSVVTDRLGTLPAYRLDAARGAVSTVLRSLVDRSRRQLDAAGVAGFFATGFYPGERTLLADVRILRPSRRYVFDAAGVLSEVATTWRWGSAIRSAPTDASTAISA